MTLRNALAVAAVLAATQAGADAFISDGIATGQSRTQTIVLGKNHMVLDTRVNFSVLTMVDDTHPMNQLSGDCFGAIEVRDGAAEGNGICVFDGLTGDRVVMGWTARRMDTSGAISGYWTINAGSGIWLQASGGGTFTMTTNPANGSAANAIKGAVTLR